MTPKLGVRCLKCNTDVWASVLATQFCQCQNVNISVDAGSPVIGKKKGTPYLLIRETDSGRIIAAEPMDTDRIPAGDPSIDDTAATKPKIIIPE